MPKFSSIDYVLYGIFGLILIAAAIFAATDPVFFEESFAAEDGLVEYVSALFLLLSALVLWGHARRARPGRAMILLGFYGLLFFFAAGEEISWGQRIFGIESGEFFLENNKQAETNLHNLVVGNVSLASFLFGNVLTVVLLAYLVVLPLMYPRFAWVQGFVRALMVPVPHLLHAALTLLLTAVVLWMDQPRQWEVYEAAFAILAMTIFLKPANLELFRP